MKVVFTWVGPDLAIPRLLVASVRKNMPGAEVVQCSDLGTAEVEGVSSVRRLPLEKPDHLMIHRLQHMADFDEPTLLLDADALVLRDVRPFADTMAAGGLDVALTWRASMPVPPPGFPDFPEFTGKDIGDVMPYNTGAVFCRNPQVWRDAHNAGRTLGTRWQRWFGDQRGLAIALERGAYKVAKLSPVANYTPTAIGDPAIYSAYIIQYKGPKRKPWMAVHAERFNIIGAKA
jgi:hypothetical protein